MQTRTSNPKESQVMSELLAKFTIMGRKAFTLRDAWIHGELFGTSLPCSPIYTNYYVDTPSHTRIESYLEENKVPHQLQELPRSRNKMVIAQYGDGIKFGPIPRHKAQVLLCLIHKNLTAPESTDAEALA